MKSIGFVVLNYNDANTTIFLIDSLIEWHNLEFEMQIVIVDNQSKDNSYDILKGRYQGISNVTVIRSEKNGGYSYGNNFGVKYLMDQFQPEFVAIANPDIQIEKEMLLELLNTFDEDEKIGMVAPVMKDSKGNYMIKPQRLPSYYDDLFACFNSSRSKTIVTDEYSCLNGKSCMVMTQMIPGSFFVVRSAFFYDIGMFDEAVFLFCEERIIGKKMSDKGYKMVIRSDLFFVHAHSTTIKRVYDTIKTWKILMDSRYYYEKEYNKCGIVKLAILKLCMKSFLIGLKIKMMTYELVKGKR